jgi:hypothetical protein
LLEPVNSLQIALKYRPWRRTIGRLMYIASNESDVIIYLPGAKKIKTAQHKAINPVAHRSDNILQFSKDSLIP